MRHPVLAHKIHHHYSVIKCITLDVKREARKLVCIFLCYQSSAVWFVWIPALKASVYRHVQRADKRKGPTSVLLCCTLASIHLKWRLKSKNQAFCWMLAAQLSLGNLWRFSSQPVRVFVVFKLCWHDKIFKMGFKESTVKHDKETSSFSGFPLQVEFNILVWHTGLH